MNVKLGPRPVLRPFPSRHCRHAWPYPKLVPDPETVRSDMAEDDAKPKGPDLTQGVAPARFPENGMLLGHVGEDEVLLVKRARTSSPSTPIAPIIMARLPTGWWWATPFAAPGIMPVSIFAAARRCARPPSIPLACWKVEQRDGKIFVRRENCPRRKPKPSPARQGARKNRDRRRRRGRLCRGRNAAPARLSGRASSC